MVETAPSCDRPELAQLRLLTEVRHFLAHMDANGNVPDDVFAAVVQNRTTAASEIAVPDAITTTFHEVTQETDADGRRQQTIWWLGKTAVEVAMSGYDYHFSLPAFERVDVEVLSARFEQQRLRPGMAQPFISPELSAYDVLRKYPGHDNPIAIAKAEHLYGDDSIRVSTAVTDIRGQVTGRKLQSLLVHDIPLAAWVALCQDPGNIFGKALPIRDVQSAVSVMELFGRMELPEAALPHGPITLVEAVLPYIQDDRAKQSVEGQLARFHANQEFYAQEAALAGKDWAKFDLELARSLRTGKATNSLRFFMMHNAHAWREDTLAVLRAHELGNTRYAMTDELAACLARDKQKLLGDALCVVTDNMAATRGVSEETRRLIKSNHAALTEARAQNLNPEYIRSLEREQYALLHRQPIRSGGGCSGDVPDAFRRTESPEDTGVGENANAFESRSTWKWKRGVCQVKICPSPKPTEVGPCSVCRRCQDEFDAGRDPTGITGFAMVRQSQTGMAALAGELFRRKKRRTDRARGKYLTRMLT